MAGGGSHVSASREPSAARRPIRAPLVYNEKEYFYRQRVLRRARKMSASPGRPGLPPTLGSPDTAAALLLRCSNLEWSAAVAHYNAAQLYERVCRLEAAAASPALPLSAASPEVQPGDSAANLTDDSAPAADASREAAAADEGAEDKALQSSVQRDDQRAALPLPTSLAQTAAMEASASETDDVVLGNAADSLSDVQSTPSLKKKKKKKRQRRAADVGAAVDAKTAADAEPVADGGAMASVSAAQPSIDEFANDPKQHDAAVPQHRSPIEAWAVVQGLQSATHSHHNGRLVRVGIQRLNGRFETVRAGTQEKLAVRPENLRWLLQSYDGRAVGDDLADEDDGYGELVLLGFDPVRQQWACKHLLNREGGSARYRYRWARIEPSEVSLN